MRMSILSIKEVFFPFFSYFILAAGTGENLAQWLLYTQTYFVIGIPRLQKTYLHNECAIESYKLAPGKESGMSMTSQGGYVLSTNFVVIAGITGHQDMHHRRTECQNMLQRG